MGSMSNALTAAIEALTANFTAIAKRQRELAAKAISPKVKALRERTAASYDADLPRLVNLITNGCTDGEQSLAEYVCDEGYATWTDERGNLTSVYILTDANGWLGKGEWFMNRLGQVREQVGERRLIKTAALAA